MLRRKGLTAEAVAAQRNTIWSGRYPQLEPALVEPAGALPHVDDEHYVMQGEIYTTAPKGKAGLQQFSAENLMQEPNTTFSTAPLRCAPGEVIAISAFAADIRPSSMTHAVTGTVPSARQRTRQVAGRALRRAVARALLPRRLHSAA